MQTKTRCINCSAIMTTNDFLCADCQNRQRTSHKSRVADAEGAPIPFVVAPPAPDLEAGPTQTDERRVYKIILACGAAFLILCAFGIGHYILGLVHQEEASKREWAMYHQEMAEVERADAKRHLAEFEARGAAAQPAPPARSSSSGAQRPAASQPQYNQQAVAQQQALLNTQREAMQRITSDYSNANTNYMDFLNTLQQSGIAKHQNIVQMDAYVRDMVALKPYVAPSQQVEAQRLITQASRGESILQEKEQAQISGIDDKSRREALGSLNP